MKITRKSPVLKNVPETKPDKLSRLKKRNFLVGDPEDFVHMDWLSKWTELKAGSPETQPSRRKRKVSKGAAIT